MTWVEYKDRYPRNGRTIREAAELTGLSTRSIERWTSRPREEYLSIANSRREKIIELHKTGLGVRAIAREMGVSPATVSIRLKEARETGVLKVEPEEDEAA